MNPKEFHEMLSKLRLTSTERSLAWNHYKTVSPELAIAFVQGIVSGCEQTQKNFHLRPSPIPYKIWGQKHIQEEAIAQMGAAARLPVAIAGALMPDAHTGYGLPIGGVLATKNVVIPYAVGVDIACRMMLTVYPSSSEILKNNKSLDYKHLYSALVNGVAPMKADHLGSLFYRGNSS